VDQVEQEKPSKFQSTLIPHGTVKWSVPQIVGTWASKNEIDDSKKPDLGTFPFNPSSRNTDDVPKQAQDQSYKTEKRK
jgi:hypothetical protein